MWEDRHDPGDDEVDRVAPEDLAEIDAGLQALRYQLESVHRWRATPTPSPVEEDGSDSPSSEAPRARQLGSDGDRLSF